MFSHRLTSAEAMLS